MDNLPQVIGKNIKKYRKLNGLKRHELATIIDIDEGYLGQCERGERQLGLTKVVKIIEYFGVSANDIIDVKVVPSTENKQKLIDDINKCISNCSDNQLTVLLNILLCLVPYLKG